MSLVYLFKEICIWDRNQIYFLMNNFTQDQREKDSQLWIRFPSYLTFRIIKGNWITNEKIGRKRKKSSKTKRSLFPHEIDRSCIFLTWDIFNYLWNFLYSLNQCELIQSNPNQFFHPLLPLAIRLSTPNWILISIHVSTSNWI